MKLFKALCGFLLKLGRKNGLYYISSPTSLPPPLTVEEENELLPKLGNHPELRQVLVERNLRLVVYIAKRFENTGIELDDLISVGTIGLIKASNTFDPEKNIKTATYASRCIENEILMYIRKNNPQRAEMSLDEPLHTDKDGNELLIADIMTCDECDVCESIEADEEKKLVRRLVRDLNSREREIIELRFGLNDGKELTQKQTAERLGISQSYISRLEKKIINELKEKLESLI